MSSLIYQEPGAGEGVLSLEASAAWGEMRPTGKFSGTTFKGASSGGGSAICQGPGSKGWGGVREKVDNVTNPTALTGFFWGVVAENQLSKYHRPRRHFSGRVWPAPIIPPCARSRDEDELKFEALLCHF